MDSQDVPKIFVIGGTGAQGIPIVRSLVSDKKYQVRGLTRNASSRRAQELYGLGNVELFEGTLANETTLHNGLRGCYGAFVNIDGFNTGEKAEIFWAIRIYEIALEEGLKFFVYGNHDYALKAGAYNSRYRCGHLDGKGRIGEWILWQNAANMDRMDAALFTGGPYIDMSISGATMMSPTIEDGIVTWRIPVGDVRAFRCPARLWLLSIAHISFHEMAAAFERVTGRPAQYIEMSMDDYWALYRDIADLPTAYNADPDDASTMSTKDNFTGFWNFCKDDLMKREYAILDEIHPNRIRTAEQWFRIEEANGQASGKGSLWDRVQPENLLEVLKRGEDGDQGTLQQCLEATIDMGTAIPNASKLSSFISGR
ncbi:hypothetical protein Trihar35433_2945 [Trichoderma harzianum]|nr:hypothetical protein Trihar35433_2945 [Trichoderma harzianum]